MTKLERFLVLRLESILETSDARKKTDEHKIHQMRQSALTGIQGAYDIYPNDFEEMPDDDFAGMDARFRPINKKPVRVR